MEYKVVCKGLNNQAKGIIEIDKKKITVQNLLKDEEALVEVSKKEVKVKQILTSSKERQKVNCHVYDRCGGCQMLHMTKEAQRNFKMKFIEDLFKNYKINPIIEMENPENYRHKVIATFSTDKNKKIVAGIYEENSHHVVKTENCLIQNKKANDILKSIVALANQMKYTAYDEDRRSGLLRHVLIRVSAYYNEVLVCFVVGNTMFGGSKNLVSRLKEKHPEIKTIVMNVNNRKTSIVLGNQERVLYGKGTIKDNLLGLNFNIGAKTFYQVNPYQTEKLYSVALKMANLKKSDVVLDAYCGIGTISLLAAKQCSHVDGVEINAESIKQAIVNAKNNMINNVRFYTSDCSEYMMKAASKKQKYDVVIMDPAREGSDERFLKSMVNLKPKRIVYISCGPITQKRDTDYLLKNGYVIKEIQPVDLFSLTTHVETVVLMSRKER